MNNIPDVKDQQFNIEDLIKRIDAKILELEKEEQEQNKKENINEENDEYDKLENTIYEKFDDFIKTSNNEETSDPVINVDGESVIVDSNNVTDDQFYDDFFTDSER